MDTTKGGLFRSLMDAAREAFRGAVAPEDINDNDVKRKLYDATRKIDPRCSYVEAVYDDRFIYSCYIPPDYSVYQAYPVSTSVLMERSYSIGGDGVVTVGEAAIEVEAMLVYEPVSIEPEPTALAGKRNSAKDQSRIQNMHDHSVALGANCGDTMKAASGKPCSCNTNKPNEETEPMTPEQLKAAIEKATPEELKALGVVKQTEAPAVVPATEEQLRAAKAEGKAEGIAEAKASAPAAPVAPTFEALLGAADEDTRNAINAAKNAAAEKKTATIASLRAAGDRCKFTDEELKAMSQSQLDNLASLAAVKPSVDYTGAGIARTAQEATTVPVARNLADEYRAAAVAGK